MNFDVLKSRIHFSKWGDSNGSVSLSYDVTPEGQEYLEIGDAYLFAPSGRARIFGKDERRLIGASVLITSNREVIEPPKQFSQIMMATFAGG
jgi:hypothetical protein